MEAIARKNPSLGSRLIKIVHLALECGSSEPSGVSIDRNIGRTTLTTGGLDSFQYATLGVA